MADGDKIDVNTDGLHAASKKILELGDSTDRAVADGSGLAQMVSSAITGGNLAGFATDGPLRRIPEATAHAGHTLAGRFYVLGELVTTAADQYQAGDAAAARAINTAGYLNDPGDR